MDRAAVVRLKERFGALNNIHRINIILLCGQRGHTISELSKALVLKYKVTSHYVNILAKAQLVAKTRNADSTVTVRSLVTVADSGEVRLRQ